MTGRAEDLLAALTAADAAIGECWADWDRLLYGNGRGPVPPAASEAHAARLAAAHAARQAAAQATWAYFGGPAATAEERAAWTLMAPSWARTRNRE